MEKFHKIFDFYVEQMQIYSGCTPLNDKNVQILLL